MIFNTAGFPKFSSPDRYLGIRNMNSSSLILIKPNGMVESSRFVAEKDRMVSVYVEGEDLLLFAWHGQYRTDIFILTKEDLAKHYLPNHRNSLVSA